jgi:hypothetical protein
MLPWEALLLSGVWLTVPMHLPCCPQVLLAFLNLYRKMPRPSRLLRPPPVAAGDDAKHTDAA